MKKLLFIAIISLASNFTQAFELEAGDVLLISFNCYECRVIESETNSTFSHSGLVIKDEFHNIKIAQSIGQVALYPIEKFLKYKTPGSAVAVYRPIEFKNIDEISRTLLEEKMLSIFNSEFKGAPFDVKYLWHNYDKNGRELLYCSEFIAKFLDYFLATSTKPYSLTYDKNKNYWLKYFQGLIPEGELGNSPASFSHDKRFTFLGNL